MAMLVTAEGAKVQGNLLAKVNPSAFMLDDFARLVLVRIDRFCSLPVNYTHNFAILFNFSFPF